MKNTKYLLLFSFIMMLLFFGACNQIGQENATPQVVENKKQVSESKVQEGFTKDKDGYYISFEGAKDYMRKIRDEGLPANYKIPDYVKPEKTVTEVMDVFNERYPTFFGKRKDDLVQAVRENPTQYKEMIWENLAIREIMATSEWR